MPDRADGGTFRLEVDDDGRLFWRGGVDGDKDETRFEPGEPLVLNPEAWPAGTVVSASVPLPTPQMTEFAGAFLDTTRQYRYVLWRGWDPTLPRAVFIMLNPSTADEVDNDRTILKCIRFAKRWGLGSLWVVNLFAWRATDPDDLADVPDPIGPENDAWILKTAAPAEGLTPLVVAGWGNHGQLRGRARSVVAMLRGQGIVPHYLKLTKSSEPQHPLYLPESLRPMPLPATEVAP